MKRFFSKVFGVVLGGSAGIVATVAGELWTDIKESRQNQRQINKAVAEYKAQQALSESTYKRDWELQALQGSGVWMKRGTLILFSWPLVLGPFYPVLLTQYFETLEQIPDWYLASYGSMLAAIWGSMELRNWKAGKRAGVAT